MKYKGRRKSENINDVAKKHSPSLKAVADVLRVGVEELRGAEG